MRSRIHALVALMLAAPVAALAQGAPTFPGGKPITLILPFAPGGSVDSGFRLLAPALEKELQTRVEIVNKGGAGGQTGVTEFIRTAEPDGYTMVNVGLPTVLTQYLDPARGAIYARRNFQPVAQTWTGSYGIAVAAASPIRDFTQFLAAAKDKGGRLTVGDSGLMAAPHLMAALLEKAAGVKFASVHLNGGAAANAALLGGHVEAMAGGLSDFTANHAAGLIRVLALATDEPKAGAEAPLPGVRTMGSFGTPLSFLTIQSAAVPAGTPMPVVRILEGAFRKVLADPEIAKKMAGYGNLPNFMGADELAAVWAKYENDLRPVMADLN